MVGLSHTIHPTTIQCLFPSFLSSVLFLHCSLLLFALFSVQWCYPSSPHSLFDTIIHLFFHSTPYFFHVHLQKEINCLEHLTCFHLHTELNHFLWAQRRCLQCKQHYSTHTADTHALLGTSSSPIHAYKHSRPTVSRHVWDVTYHTTFIQRLHSCIVILCCLM